MGPDSRGSSPLGQRRSQAPPGLDSLRLLQVPFALMILGKQKSSRFSRKLFAGAVDETEFEPEAPASVTCFSMDFIRWSSENSQYICQPILWASTTNWNLSGSLHKWSFIFTSIIQIIIC